tara:strand:- start:950 stop:1525 length:576 start_codon:yes stop_codon:yes gene_type:complete
MSNELKNFYAKSRKDWRSWLEKNHESENAIWLVFYKVSSSKPSLSWSEAVDEALCFGWIDSTKKTIDQDSYKQYFSKRKAVSNWSKINKEKVEKLIEDQQMTKAGFHSIEVAKKYGSWYALDKIEDLIMPDDLKEAMNQYSNAMEYYESLSKSAKKLLLHWVYSAKKTETREKRILQITEAASKKEKPKGF